MARYHYAPANEAEIPLNLLAELAADYMPGLCHGDDCNQNLVALTMVLRIWT